jgi:phosphoribosylformimino-5-aminoimidazole carboxamide ribotide isomerase
MAEFTLIPAVDLKDGIVVHAKAGNRIDYRPIASPFGAPDDPVAIAGGLLKASGSSILYIADLDAIGGTGNHFELVRGLGTALHGTALWIDAGFADVADCAFWLPLGATLVIGSESLAGIGDWVSIHEAFGESVVLSLDYDAEGPRGPNQLFDDPTLWPRRVIVMSLARVGIGTGPDLARIEEVVGKAGGRDVYTAGGVRDVSDLAAIGARGARGALVGTALHAGALTQKEIAALLRERRP